MKKYAFIISLALASAGYGMDMKTIKERCNGQAYGITANPARFQFIQKCVLDELKREKKLRRAECGTYSNADMPPRCRNSVSVEDGEEVWNWSLSCKEAKIECEMTFHATLNGEQICGIVYDECLGK